jgi:hypothetical protein
MLTNINIILFQQTIPKVSVIRYMYIFIQYFIIIIIIIIIIVR